MPGQSGERKVKKIEPQGQLAVFKENFYKGRPMLVVGTIFLTTIRKQGAITEKASRLVNKRVKGGYKKLLQTGTTLALAYEQEIILISFLLLSGRLCPPKDGLSFCRENTP